MSRKSIISLILLSSIWIATFLFIDPLHDFPLNDDWSYALSVKAMVEEGKLYLTDWNASPILTLILWGSLFCIPFGFSFEALTISTLVSGLVGVLFTYSLIKIISGNRLVSFIAALLIAINPLYLSLSVTFMMDVHFYALFIMSISFYLRFFKDKSNSWFIPAFLSTLFAMFLRQFAIVVPITFLVLEIISHKKMLNRPALLNTSAVLFILAAYFIFNQWLEEKGMLPANFRGISDLMDVSMAEMGWRIFIRTGFMLVEAGVWLFPLILFIFIKSIASFRKRILWLAVSWIIFLIPMIRVIGDFPAGNILYNLGLGPVTTRDVFILGLTQDLFSVPWVINVFRILGLAGGGMLVVLAVDKLILLAGAIRSNRRSLDELYALSGVIALILYAGIVMINFTYFDRYILPILPLFMMTLIPGNKSRLTLGYPVKAIFTLFLTGLLVFGVLSTRHYLEWNEARWELIRAIESEGVPAEIIDGGHEYNGWSRKKINREGKWDISGQEYVISFTEIRGFNVIKKHIATNPLTGKEYFVYVLKKNDVKR